MTAITYSFSGWWNAHKEMKGKLIVSLIFLVIAVAIYSTSGDYVSDHSVVGNAHDIILNITGPHNLSIIFVWLYILVIALFFLYPLFFKPYDAPYVIIMFSLFLIIRGGFILLTRLSTPVDAIHVVFPSIFQPLNFSNDLFFSGHTGLTFLGYLIFRKHHKGLSYFMLASSILLSIVVLLMHLHYTIDVVSAFFITYGIYKIGNKFLGIKD